MKTISTVFFTLLGGAGLMTSVARADPSSSGPELPGVLLTSGHLRVRFVDNSPRLNVAGDGLLPGYSGVASLVYAGQERNIFGPGGLNYEMGSTTHKQGQRSDLWNAPRMAPMALEKIDARTVRLTQKGAEAAGLNVEIVYRLGESYIDQTITTWPDTDIESSRTFWASYMLFLQNTSLYLRASLKDDPQMRWREMTSAGHNGSGRGTYFRCCEPAGKTSHELLIDDPVSRQEVFETATSRAATEAAGFRPGEITVFDNFYFGFVDDFVALSIFQPPAHGHFMPWLSASGAQALRRPAWDFSIESGPQRAGERRTYRLRFVYKPYAGLDDLLQEVERFRGDASDNQSP